MFAPVVPIADAPSAPPAEPARGPLEAATYAELLEVGQEAKAAGVAALLLARRLDGVSADTGSSVAAVIREHGRKLAEAIAAGTAEADPLDEMAKRRQDRRARA